MENLNSPLSLPSPLYFSAARYFRIGRRKQVGRNRSTRLVLDAIYQHECENFREFPFQRQAGTISRHDNDRDWCDAPDESEKVAKVRLGKRGGPETQIRVSV